MTERGIVNESEPTAAGMRPPYVALTQGKELSVGRLRPTLATDHPSLLLVVACSPGAALLKVAERR
jgi:hypothetical protein